MVARKKLEGTTVGELEVLEYLGNKKYRCLCSCGAETIANTSNLVTGHTKSCGHLKEKDIAGQTFGRLKALRKVESQRQGERMKSMWLCECQCGKLVTVRRDSLVGGKTRSCGCLAAEHKITEKIQNYFVDGTCLFKLQAQPSKNNKSGVVGVNWDKSRGLWQARIRFRGKRYNLGRFADFEEACKVRKKAEEKIHGEFLEWYENERKNNE